MVHKIGVIAMQRLIPYDLTIACEVFGRLVDAGGRPLYEVKVCGEAQIVEARAFNLVVPFGLSALRSVDTIIVPGIEDVSVEVPRAVVRLLQAASRRGVRIASICSGAFVLAAAGLLDGRRATTHWLCADELQRRYPDVTVDPNVLYVDEGQIITSAGASAGLDMCLHLVRRDFGQAFAAKAARLAVTPVDRDGGQAQYIRRDPPRSVGSLAPLLEWMAAHMTEALTVRQIAARARMSERSFARHFQEQVGVTPMHWLLNARIRRAQELLEASTAYADDIAISCGFQSTVTFRSSFKRIVGLTPVEYRRTFNSPAAAVAMAASATQ
jgi:transcriptional regulator GlxA family with amidase domain